MLRKHCKQMSFEDLVKSLLTGRYLVNSAYCFRHGRHCSIQQASCHAAGTPCIDFSAMGSHLGVDGTSCLAFLTWCAQRLQMKEGYILHENVQEFKHEILFHLLGAEYEGTTMVLDMTHFGAPARRSRRFTLLVHKRLLEGRRNVPRSLAWSQEFIDLFKRRRATTYDIYFVAHADELRSELEWAGSRTRSMHHGKNR